MDNSQNARNRRGPEMVAIFGSAAVPGSRARDVDFVYSGVPLSEAVTEVMAWVEKNRPEMVSSQGHVPLDGHKATWVPTREESGGYFEPLQAVEESDPVVALVGPAPGVTVQGVSLPRAVRFFARHGHLPKTWRLRVGLSGRDIADAYFGGGRDALLTAMTKVRYEDRSTLFALLGPVFRLLIERNLTEDEVKRLRRGFPGCDGAPGLDWYYCNGEWICKTTHGPPLIVLDEHVFEG